MFGVNNRQTTHGVGGLLPSDRVNASDFASATERWFFMIFLNCGRFGFDGSSLSEEVGI
jgi:hypothetical protein